MLYFDFLNILFSYLFFYLGTEMDVITKKWGERMNQVTDVGEDIRTDRDENSNKLKQFKFNK